MRSCDCRWWVHGKRGQGITGYPVFVWQQSGGDNDVGVWSYTIHEGCPPQESLHSGQRETCPFPCESPWRPSWGLGGWRHPPQWFLSAHLPLGELDCFLLRSRLLPWNSMYWNSCFQIADKALLTVLTNAVFHEIYIVCVVFSLFPEEASVGKCGLAHSCSFISSI